MSSSGTPHTYPPASSIPGLDPNLKAIVNHILKSRMLEVDHQFSAQLTAWKAQEAEMLNRESVMREAIEILNTKLAVAQSEAIEAKKFNRCVFPNAYLTSSSDTT